MIKKIGLIAIVFCFQILGFAQTALNFDGVNDYLPVKGTTKLNSLQKFTFETWLWVKSFNTSPCADCAPIIWHKGSTAAYRFGTGNAQTLNLAVNINGTTNTIVSSAKIGAASWHHISGTYDGSKLRLYIDGVCTDSSKVSGNITYAGTGDVWVVDDQTGFGGTLEETRIWDYARSLKEIQEGMIKHYPGSKTGLVIQFSYEDGVAFANNTSVTTVKDASNYGHDGAPGNFRMTDSSSNFVLGRSYCDSIRYSKYSVSKCVSYTVPSKKRVITKSGTYNDTIVSVKGCDSVMTINVTILKPTGSSVTVAKCDSFVNPQTGVVYKFSGKYPVTQLKNKAGCDSTITYFVTIYKKDTTSYNYDACNSVVLKNGNTVTKSGTYIDRLTNYHGCDSIIIHNVNIRYKSLVQKTLKICKFLVCPSNKSKIFKKPGTYYDTLVNYVNCDSIIQYNLISASSSSVYNVKACGSLKSPSKKYTYTKSGTYYDTLLNGNKAGCDSFITINLTLTTAQQINLTPTACRVYVSPTGKYTVYNSQKLTDIISDKNGCDSIVYTIDVTVVNVNKSISQNGNVLTAGTLNPSASFQWLDCGLTYSQVTGETNKTYTVTKSGTFAVEVTENSCKDTSNCVAVQVTGINTLSEFGIQIFPNPTSGIVHLRANRSISGTSIEISNLMGQTIDKKFIGTLNRDGYDFNLLQGMYVIRILSDQGSTSSVITVKP